MKAKTNVYTLKLDFDGNEKEFLENIKRIRNVFRIIGFLKLTDVKVKQTKKGFHTYLYIESPKIPLNSIDLVALQSLMNSDYKRESFNFLRVKSNVGLFNNEWNVLFSQKWENTPNNESKIMSIESDRYDLKSLFLAENQVFIPKEHI
jgi:hypothetical protein